MAKLELLKELVKTIDRNNLKSINILSSKKRSGTISDEFYQALLDDKFETEEEYIKYLYDKSEPPKAYYKLKDRLQDRLITTLFFIDANNTGSVHSLQRAYYECYKNSLAINILIGKGARLSAIEIAEKTYKKSSFHGFTDISISLARILWFHYGNIENNKRKFDFFCSNIKYLIKLERAEIAVEERFLNLHRNFINSTFVSYDLIPETTKAFKKLKGISKKYSSYKIFFYTKWYFITYFEVQNDWRNVIKYCNKAIKELKNNPQYKSSNLEKLFTLKKISSSIILKKFKKAEKYSNECLNYFGVGGINWLITCDCYFRLCLHSTRFEKAKEVLGLVTINKKKLTRYRGYTETWRINEAFIQYLTLIGKIPKDPEAAPLKPFRLGKFLNEVPTFSQDKRGSNITILILQILFLLEKQEYHTIIDRTESLKAYSYRYLKQDDTFRSNCFIKMLLCLPAADFQKEQVQQRAKKYLTRLRTVPIEKAKQSAEIEVMPYEMLWDLVLESMDRQKNRALPQ